MPGIDSFAVGMLHLDGADGSTTITGSELTPKTWTAAGNFQIDTAQSVFGGASGLADGTGDYCYSADSADWNMGTGNLTEEARFRFASLTGNQRLICNFQDASNQTELVKYADDNTLKFIVTVGGSQILALSGSFSPSTNTWYHLAVVRGWGGNANDWALTVNGTSIVTSTVSITMPDLTGNFIIGSSTEGTANLNGWVDEVRISKGIARWTSNFTPAAEAYSVDAAGHPAVMRGAFVKGMNRIFGNFVQRCSSGLYVPDRRIFRPNRGLRLA